MTRDPDILASVNFSKFKNISCSPAFLAILGKEEENLEKKLFDKNGPKLSRKLFLRYSH